MRVIIAIFKRNLITFVRDKGRLFGMLVMPLFMLFVCSYVMTSGTTGVSSPINYLISGVVIMIIFQGTFNASTAVLTDISSGFMKEIIVAPISRLEIALGNIFSSAVLSTIQGILVLILGLFFGFRISPPNLVLMLILMLLAAVVLSAVALYLSLLAKNQTNFQMISTLAIFPAMFLSGAYLPTTILPTWLLPVVYINPLTYLTAAFRYAVLDMSGLSTAQLIQEGVAIKIGSLVITPQISWIFVLIVGVVFLCLCIRKFQRVNFMEIKMPARFGTVRA